MYLKFFFIFKEPDRQIVLVELQFLISATCGTNKKRYMGYLLFTKQIVNSATGDNWLRLLFCFQFHQVELQRNPCV